MHLSTLLSLAAGIATAQANTIGFNYGNTLPDGSYKATSDYEAEFSRAKTLQGTNGEFTSARLYTMIQGGTTNTPNAALEAAMSTGTTLLLGMWASEDQSAFDYEIQALQSAISQYGENLAKLIVGLSVGSEDLYRITPTGIQNDAGVGQEPGVLVSYIKQARSAIANTAFSGVKVGHVDTWTAWVNSSNFEVTDNCDWLGVDSYPYFQTTVANSITNGNSTFWQSYDNTVGAAQGKEVWVTETGWPVSGPNSGEAVASVANAEIYWQEVACALLPSYNTWWYTLSDAPQPASSPSFGLVGENIDTAPLYDLKCKKEKPTASATTSTVLNTHATGHASNHHSNGTMSSSSAAASSTMGASKPSGSAASSGSSPAAASSSAATAAGTNDAATPKVGAAALAGILAIFGMVAAL